MALNLFLAILLAEFAEEGQPEEGENAEAEDLLEALYYFAALPC